MLVINKPTNMPSSERRVAEWMESWTGTYAMPGLAVSSYWLPGARLGENSQECDFVLITPQVTAAVEVKGTRADITSGTIDVRENGPWRHSHSSGNPLRVLEGHENPFRQVMGCTYRLKALSEGPGLLDKPWVHGIVLVVPPRESRVALDIRSKPPGTEVVIGNNEFRAWLHGQSRRKTIWTAEKVHALLHRMNLQGEVRIEDLLTEGFPGTASERKVAEPNRPNPAPTRAVTGSGSSPTTSSPSTGPAAPVSAPETTADSTAHRPGEFSVSRPVPHPLRPQPAKTRRPNVVLAFSRHRTGVRVAAAAVFLAAIIGGILAVRSTPADEFKETGEQQLVSSTATVTPTGEAEPEPGQAPPPGTDQAPPLPPPVEPEPGPGCFPFQPNC